MTTEHTAGYMIPVERIEQGILLIRGQRAILDADLALLYGVTTKALNQAVKRNPGRFPAEFVFQLTAEEKTEVVTICDHLSKLRFSHSLPYAFTEHGAVMAASVLNSPRAVEVSVFVVKAFIHMRRLLADQRQFAFKLSELESKLASHDTQFKVVFDAIRLLMQKPKPQPEAPKRRIGFHVSEPMAKYYADGKRRKR